MKWFLLVSVLGVAAAQTLFFRPHHKEDNLKIKENGKFGGEKNNYFQMLRETGLKEAPKVNEGVVVCPGNKSACPTGNTCCLTATGGYGCCPLPNAVCCLDKKHCCPFGTKCDITKGNCQRGNIAVPWQQKTDALQLEDFSKGDDQLLSAVICPGGEQECQNGFTCCKSGDVYECCPYENAVCCSDEIHCCPKDTKCDLSHSKCVGENKVTDMMMKQSAVSSKQQLNKWTPLREMSNWFQQNSALVNSVKCDADEHFCPDGSTCCKVASGEWGCCPLPQAVCCSDHEHCCPHGETCDVSHGKCLKKDTITDWFVKTPALKVNNVKCDDEYSCPDGSTCCKLEAGGWGCCPLPQAVCCSDHEHCCPHGETCDVSHGKCLKKDTITDWFVKTPALKVNNVKCDDEYSCPDGSTCCKLEAGGWGCCPLPQAVCCSDHEHCCPHGETCDVSHGKCLKKDTITDWFVKTPALKVNNVKCDDEYSCPDGSTCCKLEAGGWGCCPLPQAVCCSDHEHCCPEGTTCDVSQGKCNKGDKITNWLMKTQAVALSNPVRCSDTHECPTGNTCCKLKSGEWGCCPKPNAVCCSDKIHCCPHGATCSEGQCVGANTITNWLVKTPAVSTNLRNVVCPGGTASCPDGNTCCKLSSGEYGCCPLPNAVCCSDKIHCCPHGATCSEGQCVGANTITNWLVKTPAVSTNLRNVVCPGGTASCPDGNTCCKLSSGEYGCCPLPNAVCCSDKIHCCPHGTTCSGGQCVGANTITNWLVKTPAVSTKVSDVVCPGGQSECPDGNTCCKLQAGGYGCCPMPNAVCCSDHVHCCPQGTTCDVKAGKCERGDVRTAWLEKTAAITAELRDVVCPGGKSKCPDGNTCCKLSSGQYGCCPLPNAVCCSDHVHCCPQGTTCDVKAGKCEKGDVRTAWLEKTTATAIELRNVVCPGGKSECPDGNTCCQLSSGQYGCCPLPNAVCCSDHVHCCPQGTTCDVKAGKCEKGDVRTAWLEKTTATAIELRNVVCPGGKSECPDGNTCCQLSSGQYGCCPLPNAVCCSDHVHCCPQGTTCDVKAGKCEKGDVRTAWLEKTTATAIELRNVVCPGGKSECPDGNTCCQLSSGQYGCCPLPNAVCCSDHVHCCPQGTTCDVKAGKCEKGDVRTAWLEKTTGTAIELRNVVCPGGKSECPDGNTCCQLSSGQYGCCPLPNAVCCSDHVHCCPQGTTCDVKAGKCEKGDVRTAWLEKTTATAIELRNVVCPGGKSECPDGNTCCQLSSGQYGCCPLPNAVCCSDHVHCCPQGTTCDVKAGKCEKGDVRTAWLEKTTATAIELRNVVCPGGKSECPDGNTCCQLSSGQYGCCPLPNAVCCSDHVHCCPQGTTCDVIAGKCEKGDVRTAWLEKTTATAIELRNVVCPGGKSECPDGNTCCQLSSGQYGCCPLPNAVCCSDHVHCCPQGTTCDVKAGKCEKGDVRTAWLEKTTATSTALRNVVCPDHQSTCPDGNTCCQLSSGEYGCCPLPNAVCCSDHVHCCPQGTTCDVKAGKCEKGDVRTAWLEKTTATSTALRNVVCPDHQSTCPDGNTCCQLSSGEYGCCPLPNAVCCSDHVHCCPQGTTCDVKAGTCVRGDIHTNWLLKTLAAPAQLTDVVCPGGEFMCPDGTTCCQVSGGHWACCPIPNAVCCSDKKHCCPQGTTCDSKGVCKRSGIVMDWFEKMPATARVVNTVPVQRVNTSVFCPDGSICDEGQTCCIMDSGKYGCCPCPSAVCCSDHIHCCPQGYTCDMKEGDCVKTDILNRPWEELLQSEDGTLTSKENRLVPVNRVEDSTCPGGKPTCTDEQTCCQNDSGEYDCCPLPRTEVRFGDTSDKKVDPE